MSDSHNDRNTLAWRLRTASEEGLEPNVRRWFTYAGYRDGEWVELQSIDVPDRRWRNNQFAHAQSVDGAIKLLELAEPFLATGVYLLINRINPAVATRETPGQWHVAKKGESTTDADVVVRRFLYIDCDAKRPKGTSSTREELHAALEVMSQVYERLAGLLGSTASLAAGMSGNGGAILVALEDLPPTDEVSAVIKGVLAALSQRHSTASVEIDTSVSDLKRLCPAWGTTKRKGAAGIEERPHRRTALITPDRVERVGHAALEGLLAALVADLTPEQRAAVDKAMGRKPATSKQAASKGAAQSNNEADPFKIANGVPIGDVATWKGLLDGDTLTCPGCRESSGPGGRVVFLGNGLKCSGARCADKGKGGFRTPVDVVMEVEGVPALHAVQSIAAQFHLELPKRQKRPESGTDKAERRGNVIPLHRDRADYDDSPEALAEALPMGRAAAQNENAAAQDGTRAADDGPQSEAPPWITDTPAQFEHLTELGLARRLVAQHGADLRYCHPWKKWLVYDGRRWKADDTGEMQRRAKATIVTIYREASHARTAEIRAAIANFAKKSEKAAAIFAMLKLAESERGIPVLPEELDCDSRLLNVENGTLDLRTGALRPHRREDLITKLAPVQYDASATAPTWLAFLDRVFGGLAALIAFVRLFLGYCLTGDVSEHCMAVAHGTGRNGKSTLFETVAALMGDYAGSVPSELLLVKKGETHPTERARLMGLRLAVSSETSAGCTIDEAAMKKITGGDKIDARRMREDWWDFTPTHKLVLYTNHKPTIRSTDEGTWSKLHLLPFAVTIPKAERDRGLKDKLWAERAGILAWIVAGAVQWHRTGLGECAEVVEATTEYRDAEDDIGGFLADRCDLVPGAKVPFKDLFAAYKSWCDGDSSEPLTQKWFSSRLSERGIADKRGAKGRRMRIGVRLREAAQG